MYGPLRDLALFDQVVLDPEVHTLVWPNGADFDPATLHEWPRSEAAFDEMARTWDFLIPLTFRNPLRIAGLPVRFFEIYIPNVQ
jgi:hypothetical protein